MIVRLFILLFLSALMLFPPWALADADRVVLEEEEIKAMQAQSIEDVLNRTPGVKASSSSISIRGSYKVKVLLDGRPINDATHAGSVRWDLVSLESLSRIEVLKSGGVEYGEDASGGVILISTGSIKTFSGRIKGYGGNYGGAYGSASVQAAQGKLGVGFDAGCERTDGFRINNDKQTLRAGARLQYKASDKRTLSLSGNIVDMEQGYAGLSEYPTPHSRNDQSQGSLLLDGKIDSLASKTYFNFGDSENTDHSKNLDSILRSTEWGQKFLFQANDGPLQGMSVGAGGKCIRAQGTGFGGHDEHGFFAFAKKGFPLGSLPLSLSLGLRGDYYSEYDPVLNPEAALMWTIGQRTFQAKANLSANTPTIRQRYSKSSTTNPNPGLGLENVQSCSLSYQDETAPWLHWGATLFANFIRDRITYVRHGAMGQYQNFGETSLKGGEANVKLIPCRCFSLAASYTYLEAKDDETGLWLTCKPKHKVKCEAAFQPWDSLLMGLSVNYYSRQITLTDNSEQVSEYATADFRAEYKHDSFSLFGEVENLADKTYLYGDGYPGWPRTWTAGASVGF
ncbi:TonB-dependent receptor plug [Desulfatibacillum aliphaticivorans]|uniref:TonB-dependent receptor plug n=1 Tax=Desulfatibacillum aliphaticivorans TaxID=218208 RepID=B8FM13_DESAL|nr:TonB-dependent receptor plug domain-containing protein [Desulfatibacillum aliphaticivorans]ACL05746.1 TonB-dependent receptor plug [Desulfatibacillum aliphaticivorans]